MITTNIPTILYAIRKQHGKEGYNSFCNGPFFSLRDMEVVGCFTDYMKCIEMTDEEKKLQSSPLKKNTI